jgi:hypothetical protein
MPTRAPISFHIDLYHYWLAKRGGRPMPARRDINPADIPVLLPYLVIVDKDDDRFRYRLVGTAVVEQFGYDFTGNLYGSHGGSEPDTIAALRAIGERIFTNARPLFATGRYETKFGNLHDVSAFLLPLSDDGTNVNMTIFTRIARFSKEITARKGWLKGASLKVIDVVDIHGVTELKKQCLDWERNCLDVLPANLKAS